MASKRSPADITDTSDSSHLEHDRLTSLINSMSDSGVVAVDRFTKIVVYNAAALNILDSNGSMQGRQLDEVMRVIDHNNQPVDIVSYVRSVTRSVTERSFRLQYDDGSTANLYLNVSPVTRGYASNSQGGFVLVLRDITREKSLEEERDEFISVVSHELRTPITIAEGNISNAQFVVNRSSEDGELTKIKQALHEAHEQILFLASMINDLSTLSRAEHGKLEAEVEPLNVHELLNELTANYRRNAEKKGLRLVCHPDPKLELLKSSRLYVREILQNFITNAIKYTETGSVAIGAKPITGGVEFSVRDSGIGISHADQEKIFDKFYRSEDYRTRQHNGTGLGLYITLKLARIIHADIDVSSELNKGSTFTISIPNL